VGGVKIEIENKNEKYNFKYINDLKPTPPIPKPPYPIC
jgi:hypothetical protein